MSKPRIHNVPSQIYKSNKVISKVPEDINQPIEKIASGCNKTKSSAGCKNKVSKGCNNKKITSLDELRMKYSN